MTTPDFFTLDAELKAENLELKREVDGLKDRLFEMQNAAIKLTQQLPQAVNRGYRLALEAVQRHAGHLIIQSKAEKIINDNRDAFEYLASGEKEPKQS